MFFPDYGWVLYTLLFVSPFCAYRQHYENGQSLLRESLFTLLMSKSWSSPRVEGIYVHRAMSRAIQSQIQPLGKSQSQISKKRKAECLWAERENGRLERHLLLWQATFRDNWMQKKTREFQFKMATWEDPELTSSYGCTESTATYGTLSSERNPKTSWVTPTLRVDEPTSKWVWEAETQSCHKPHHP